MRSRRVEARAVRTRVALGRETTSLRLAIGSEMSNRNWLLWLLFIEAVYRNLINWILRFSLFLSIFLMFPLFILFFLYRERSVLQLNGLK